MPKNKDPYKILGLSPRATLEDIKRAYRQKIKTCHPDLCRAEPSGPRAFQVLTQAYETLIRGKSHVERISRTHTTGGYHTSDNIQEDGVFLFLEASPQQALMGAVIETEIWDGEEFCLRCGGTGKISQGGEKECPACGGSGHTTIPWGNELLRMVCKKCSGTGFIGQQTCPICKGKGRISRPRKIRISLPRGIVSGTLLRLPGQGAYIPERQARGPLYVEVGVRLPESWMIQGLDIHAPIDVDIWTAIEGGQIAVRTIDGYQMCLVPPCVKNGDLIRLTGKGWSDELGRRGDHVAKVRIMMPEGKPSSLVKTFIAILRRLWPAGPSIPALPHHHKSITQKLMESLAP